MRKKSLYRIVVEVGDSSFDSIYYRAYSSKHAIRIALNEGWTKDEIVKVNRVIGDA